MVTDGHFCLMRDNFDPPPRITAKELHLYKDDILHLDVYRSATADRTDTVALWIDAASLAPHHILKHCPNSAAVYYEICSPFIHRVGLDPNNALDFDNVSLAAITSGQTVKRFDYMIIGDATCVTGLRAPYDEEETECLFKIERPVNGQSILEFWVTNPNFDHYTGNSPELQQFQ